MVNYNCFKLRFICVSSLSSIFVSLLRFLHFLLYSIILSSLEAHAWSIFAVHIYLMWTSVTWNEWMNERENNVSQTDDLTIFCCSYAFYMHGVRLTSQVEIFLRLRPTGVADFSGDKDRRLRCASNRHLLVNDNGVWEPTIAYDYRRPLLRRENSDSCAIYYRYISFVDRDQLTVTRSPVEVAIWGMQPTGEWLWLHVASAETNDALFTFDGMSSENDRLRIRNFAVYCAGD